MGANKKRTEPDDGIWIGFHKPTTPNATWRAICQGHTYDSCAEILAVLAGPGHRCVLCYPRQPPELVQEDFSE